MPLSLDQTYMVVRQSLLIEDASIDVCFVAGRKSIVVLAWAIVVAVCLSANASVSIALEMSSVTTPIFEKLSTWSLFLLQWHLKFSLQQVRFEPIIAKYI